MPARRVRTRNSSTAARSGSSGSVVRSPVARQSLLEPVGPTPYFVEGELAPPYLEQPVAVLAHVDQDLTGAQHVLAGEEQAQHVHRLLPADLAGTAAGVLQTVHLVGRVPAVGHDQAPGQEGRPPREQLPARVGDLLDQGRPEHLQHRRVALQREHAAALHLPRDLLVERPVDVGRRLVQPPEQMRGRGVHPAPVRVGVGPGQTVRPRTDHTGVDRVLGDQAVRGCLVDPPMLSTPSPACRGSFDPGGSGVWLSVRNVDVAAPSEAGDVPGPRRARRRPLALPPAEW